MLNPEHVQKICDKYDLGESLKVEKVLEGVLNHNYILETTKDKYFIKSVREKRKASLPYIYDVELFMGSKGIPAVTMLRAMDGAIFMEIDDVLYTIYEYIDSDRNHIYSLGEFKNMGALLARIHSAGSQASDTFSKKHLKTISRPLAIENFKAFKKDILAKPKHDETDKLFLKYIDLRLDLIPKFKNLEEAANTTLIHGDYHQGNLLVSKDTRNIIGVCDWELALMAPRGYELARSLIYICFDEGFKIEPAIEKARNFLAGYNSVMPITNEEFQVGLNMRLERSLTNSWIEEGYFIHGDSRANKFIQPEMDIINLFVVNKFDTNKFF
jgi:homoserine kinase type II